MAEHRPTTKASEAEGFNVALTERNYPKSLLGLNAPHMACGCASIAYFLSEALPATLNNFRTIGFPEEDRFERFVDGLTLVCSLLVDRLEIAAGEGCSPMPLLNDMEAHHG